MRGGESEAEYILRTTRVETLRDAAEELRGVDWSYREAAAWLDARADELESDNSQSDGAGSDAH